ncbi:MAG: hypothetical protein US74_C0021G0022 [Parcubacteria group bacterium GW2011_GWA2_38_13]|nr:MAG: hypothetical protein US74_C0021G0022 [Parcubacteria group bacterium GW2011_GWA2_38_13]
MCEVTSVDSVTLSVLVAIAKLWVAYIILLVAGLLVVHVKCAEVICICDATKFVITGGVVSITTDESAVVNVFSDEAEKLLFASMDPTL